MVVQQLRTPARRFWREYTRMRTAIFFLIGVVAIVAVGSFIPQQDTSAAIKVQQFIADHSNLTDLFGHIGLSLTNVFVSPIFYVLLGSLYLALLACVVRRGRALVQRTLRRYPRTPQYWGEWGSWLFHTSFFVLLIAVVWGKATGYQGLITLTDGKSFTESRAGYDQLQEGLLFNGEHAGFTMHLDSFRATYATNGEASDYVSKVTIVDHGNTVMSKDIRVNDFLGYNGVAIYQQDYGWAPRIVVRNPAGTVVFDGPVQFFGEDKRTTTGVLKVPDFGYTIPGAAQPVQIGARMAFFPDAAVIPAVNPDGSINQAQTQFGPGGLVDNNPVIDLQLFVGDLGINSGQAQNVNQLDTSKMQPYFVDAHVVPLALGQTQPYVLPGPGGTSAQFTVSFAGLHQYSLFVVKHDNGVPLVYASFAAVMAGLLTKLYARPLLERRVARKRGKPIVLDPRWTSSVSGEPQPEPASAEDQAWLASIAGDGDAGSPRLRGDL
jgi:cytochrome c biogenesis protein